MESHVQVFITGAGPTGLLMATVLQRYGISFCIIDKKSERTQTSNALGIQAHTLELLEDLGVIDPFLQTGNPVTGTHLFVNAYEMASVNLTHLASRYPFVLIVPQSKTEEFLENHLEKNKIHVERNAELTDIKKIKNKYQLIFIQNNSTQNITADYVIACDGAHSKVRELRHIPFTGNEIKQPFALADVAATTDLDATKINVFYKTKNDNGLIAVFPLKNKNFRVIFDLNKKNYQKGSDIDFRGITFNRCEGHIQINQINWQSHFWIHSKVIKTMRDGNIFFLGDAAHIHSPIGGQGMNTGMQDAYNLGWKLNLVISHNACASILNSYHAERYPVIQTLVKQTDNLTRIMLTKNPLLRTTRNLIMRPLLKIKSINQKLAYQVSMLHVYYPKSPIINYTSVISNRSPMPGQLLPEIKLPNSKYLKKFLHGKNFWLLVFTGLAPHANQIEAIEKLTQWLEKHYATPLKYCIVTPRPLKKLTNQLIDEENLIAKRFNVQRPALCLIRPDKYIAFCASGLDRKNLAHYLNSLFTTD